MSGYVIKAATRFSYKIRRGAAVLEMVPTRRGYRVDWIYVPACDRGHGVASRLLDRALEIVDRDQVECSLVAFERGSGLSESELVSWYETRGFEAGRRCKLGVAMRRNGS